MSKELMTAILKDVKVEMLDEFDRNFTRKAFFTEPWEKRMRSYSRGTLMAVTNRLRRSYRGTVVSKGVRFTSDAPYAGIHNRGGTIKVTPAMRRYFWAMYYKNTGQLTKTKNGRVSGAARNLELSAQAQFWRNMALKKSNTIKMPKRQVVGDHPAIKSTITDISNKRIKEFTQKKLLPILKK